MKLTQGVKLIKLFLCGFTHVFVYQTNLLMQTIFFSFVKRYSFQKRVRKFTSKKFYYINSNGQCYKTFYGRKLRIFVISQSICHGKLFQLCRMFVGKARSLPQGGAPESQCVYLCQFFQQSLPIEWETFISFYKLCMFYRQF